MELGEDDAGLTLWNSIANSCGIQEGLYVAVPLRILAGFIAAIQHLVCQT